MQRVSIVALTFLCFAPVGQAQEGLRSTEQGRAQVSATEARYRRPAWKAGTLRAGLPITALDFEGWKRGQLEADGTLLTLPFLPAVPDVDRPGFVVEAVVKDSVQAAQDQLIDWLADLQNPTPAPSGPSRGIEVGEVAFVGPSGQGQNTLSWVAFVRGNVAVRLLATSMPRSTVLDLAAVSRQLDARLLKQPVLPDGAVLPRPVVQELEASSAEVLAGGKVELTYAVAAPFQSGNHAEWSLAGQGQGYVEQARDGKLYLYTSRAGGIDLTLHLVASNGTITERTTHIEVLERD